MQPLLGLLDDGRGVGGGGEVVCQMDPQELDIVDPFLSTGAPPMINGV